MPLCEVSKGIQNGIKIFYRTYGHGPNKALLIIGLAGTHDSWGPQIKGLTGTETPNDEKRDIIRNDSFVLESGGVDDYEDENGIEVCAFDNRGMGQSSIPTKKSEYTTTNMAKDALALMDHLGWRKAHVFGHSMGSMIACKLAAMVPDRILSLALLNATGGGFECLPKVTYFQSNYHGFYSGACLVALLRQHCGTSAKIVLNVGSTRCELCYYG